VKGNQHFGISRFWFSGCQMSNNITKQFANSEKWKGVELTLWDFRIWFFRVSNVNQHNTTIPKFWKVKGCGINPLGFRDSCF